VLGRAVGYNGRGGPVAADPHGASAVSTAVPRPARTNSSPTTDGRPMAETDRHRRLMTDLIQALERWFQTSTDVYVSGNLLLFYEEGNKRRHVSPDVFVVFGVPKRERLNYLLWEEGRGPGAVIELTSSSTRREDTRQKFELYRDVLKVPEYFLFDPFGDYLTPRFQGHRLAAGAYRPMRVQDGRLRSRQLGLWLEPDGAQLRLVDPDTNTRLPTPDEIAAAADRARAAEAENERLRTELAALRRRPNGRNGH
jgi:Uma2 family endonuclease